MRLEQLRLENLRNISALEVELGPGLNLFVGPNGAGKTSILEGAYLLSHAQSFRAGQADTLISRGATQMALSARVSRQRGPIRLGLTRNCEGWSARVNGLATQNLGTMLREYALVCFEPGSHLLISGGSVERRRFLDWGVFHVEPAFLGKARQYSRALRQRNAALKRGSADTELDAWDAELTEAAAAIAPMRSEYFARFATELCAVLSSFLPKLGEVATKYSDGWTEGHDFAELLRRTRLRDRVRGHTTCGPHRADWSIRFAHAPQREHLSRGQEKLCALACMLAQARVYAAQCGEWPVIALDDLASELDSAHQGLVADVLRDASAQVLVSSVDIPQRLAIPSVRMFHVEHGTVRGLL